MKRKRTQKIKGRTAAQKKRRMKRALRLGFVLLILLALLLGVMKVSGGAPMNIQSGQEMP